MLRTLAHYWKIQLAVTIGAAVGTAVLTGALLVGDSVRGSLRALTVDRLGSIDEAVVGERFFREELAGTLADDPAVEATAPAVLLAGSATHAGTRSRASRVSIVGVDERFAALFPDEPGLVADRATGQVLPSTVINRELADEIGASEGDAVLLSFGRTSSIPRETLMGDTDPDDVLETVRVIVRRIVPNRGAGRFGVNASQQTPLLAYLDLRGLQRRLDRRERVNAVLVATGTTADSDAPTVELAGRLTLDDAGLRIEKVDGHGVVESDEFVLRPSIDEAVGRALDALGAPMLRTQSYLANTLRHGERRVPYSLVAALDPLGAPSWARATLAGGGVADPPGDDELLLNAWTAEQLDAAVGDTIEMTYYAVGANEALSEERVELELAGILALRDLGADAELTPDYPGIREARDISAWDPPFPVDLDRIRPDDETYWDRYGAAPKAIVSSATGRRLWSTRYGSTTSIRFGAAPDATLDATRDRLVEAIRRLDPGVFGLRVLALRSEGLAAAQGATDFAGLFVGFSLFLIVSSAMLVGLLFRLGVEQRAGEIGLLLAVGHRVGAVRRRLLAEGGLLAAAGALAGVAGAIGYAAAMVAGLRTLWRPAVGSSEITLHVEPASLAIGWTVSVLVCLVAIFLAVRRLVRRPPQRLLAGSWASDAARSPGRLAPAVATGGLAGGVLLVALAVAREAMASPGIAFGAGVLLLSGGIAGFALLCRRGGRRITASGALIAMAARNTSWNPPRSILSVALVASAVFVIAAVAANREVPGHDVRDRDSGAGGFPLVAESDVPIHQDLASAEGRFELGFSDDDSSRLEGLEVVPMRRVPGDDASCLNLYRPQKPRLLGVPDELIRRGGFRFQQSLPLDADEDDPWGLLERRFDDETVVPAIADFNSAMWILHRGLGDDVVVEDEYGRPLRLRLVALLQSSLFQSELLIHERDLLERFPSRTGDAYFLIDIGDDRLEATARRLEAGLSRYGLDVTASAEKLARYKVVEHTYLATFQLLGGLGLLLGTVGLGVVLLRNVIERRGELATLRAFGFRRSRLAAMVVAENAYLLVVGTAIGAASALLSAAPRLATIEVPWGSLGWTLAAVVLVGLLASVGAVVGALRAPLLPALKAER